MAASAYDGRGAMEEGAAAAGGCAGIGGGP